MVALVSKYKYWRTTRPDNDTFSDGDKLDVVGLALAQDMYIDYLESLIGDLEEGYQLQGYIPRRDIQQRARAIKKSS